jgi:hypothetical protein
VLHDAASARAPARPTSVALGYREGLEILVAAYDENPVLGIEGARTRSRAGRIGRCRPGTRHARVSSTASTDAASFGLDAAALRERLADYRARHALD